MCYRLAKYAIKPVSSTAECVLVSTWRCASHKLTNKIVRPLRIPLSSFIVEDMMEYVQAHATYRFILHDDEEERPRILVRLYTPKTCVGFSCLPQVWLFKPSMRIAYSTPTQYLLPKVGNIHGAKVLYRILGPETASTDLARWVRHQQVTVCGVDDSMTEALCLGIQGSRKQNTYRIH